MLGPWGVSSTALYSALQSTALDGEYKYNVFQMDPGRVVFVFHFGMNCIPYSISEQFTFTVMP